MHRTEQTEQTGQIDDVHVTTMEIDGRPYEVTVSIAPGDAEFVGHLWFRDDDWDDDGIRDQEAILGRDAEEVLRHARRLGPSALTSRFHHAQTEHRRIHGLRRVTEAVLAGTRHLHQVATSMRAGLLDVHEAAAELDATEQAIHARIDELRKYAVVTS